MANYFDNLEGKINWISKFNGQSFNGHFDGNGATIYGLYATTDGTSREDIGLFPQYDGGTRVGSRLVTNVCKNIAVKNSYFYSKRRMGAIAGASYLSGYGAKIDGKVTIDSCAVVNCYMQGAGGGNYNWSYFSEQGVIAGGGSGDIIELKNILVTNVFAYNDDQSAYINIVGNGSIKKSKDQYQNSVSNSVFLGTAPYVIDYYNSSLHEPYAYTNVVTDFPSGVVDLATPTWASSTTQKDYTDRIFSITETGVEFKKSATMLDWKNTWFMGTNGPELQVFHEDLELITTNGTHMWMCTCCGAQGVEGEQAHNFVFGGDIKYITVKNLTTNGYIDFSSCDTINEDARKKVHKRSQIAIGDILYASICPLGRTYLITEEPNDWDINESVFSIRPNYKKITSEYLNMLLKDDYYIAKLSNSSTGSIFLGIRIKQLESTQILLPSYNILSAFTKQIKDIVRLQANNYQQILSLTKQRDELLPLLMNGQVNFDLSAY
mgnify:CR=1 FL=1